MPATTRDALPDTLRRAQEDLDRRFDEIARQYAAHPPAEVLDALEHEVCAAGVTPLRPDLSALAQEIARAPATG
jgi:hypothetical protein